jgi:biotin transport system substrate-specific component
MKTKELTLVAMFAAITVVLSWLPPIPLPFSPVPITFQVIGVLMAGALLGPKLGFLSQLVYVFLGAMGLPVFAGGNGGFGIIVGPTGGYIIGFILAAFIVGWFIHVYPGKTFPKYAIAMTLGIFSIYIPGTLQLALVTGLGIQKALLIGTLPYIPLDIVKAVVVTMVAIPVNNRIKQLNLI